ncbi:uncharacterized protein K452DRAFT_288572 [Aplosporella prunicola CBS 121167]|uniref:Saposin B-type domain-containing protein n=1 Tax=Aplosporella prunicola CBS 121167 TaxID=1176127 RepID=A0A6A6BB40_9PEZI|nr:uncharacterized protein K452DRAFT_288572 [Aplosporella prunicola CBS 121167]KAF2140484.1 hypothetical protein K452DRAFT_288572 [Aplosporella prunicola CBS 121167]
MIAHLLGFCLLTLLSVSAGAGVASFWSLGVRPETDQKACQNCIAAIRLCTRGRYVHHRPTETLKKPEQTVVKIRNILDQDVTPCVLE